MTENHGPMDVSLILPVFNEEASIEAVLREARAVLHALNLRYEILAVDDGSTDRTPAIVRELARQIPELRVLAITPHSGQSAALGAGFQCARGGMIVTMDADGQNDPADIPSLLEELGRCDICCGHRIRRRDSWSKRVGSRLANGIRNLFLREDIRDTGCSLKAFRSAAVRHLPMDFDGMHRFLPALARMRGADIRQIPVRHRPRLGGRTKYSNWGRLAKVVRDLGAVRWMKSRIRRYDIREL